MEESEILKQVISYLEKHGTCNEAIFYAYENVLYKYFHQTDKTSEKIMNEALKKVQKNIAFINNSTI